MNQMLESIVGKYFVILFALFALTVYGFVYFCSDSTCTAYIILPIMPWAYIWAQDLGLPFPWAMYPIFILLNASVAYVIGATLQWLYNRYLDFKQEKKIKVLPPKENNFSQHIT